MYQALIELFICLKNILLYNLHIVNCSSNEEPKQLMPPFI
jgi:hypothetical protein